MSTAAALPTEAETRAARLRATLSALVATVEHALDSGAAQPEQAERWQRALALLRADLQTAQEAEAQLAAGEPALAANLGQRLCFLARDMDPYPLDFAGDAVAERLRSDRERVVLAAWQLKESTTR